MEAELAAPADVHARTAACEIVEIAGQLHIAVPVEHVKARERDVGERAYAGRQAYAAEVERFLGGDAGVPREHVLRRRRDVARDHSVKHEVVGGRVEAHVVELPARRLDEEPGLAAIPAGALGRERAREPAVHRVRGRIDVDVRLIGALVIVRRVGLQRQHRCGRAEHAAHADERIELPLEIARAQLRVGLEVVRGLREQAAEAGAGKRALDERAGARDDRRAELLLEPCGRPAGERRHDERRLAPGAGSGANDRIRRCFVGDRCERRDLRARCDVAAGGDRAEDATPAVERVGIAVREQRVVLDEERSLLRQLHLVRRQIHERGIGVDLAEVGVDRRGDRQARQRAQLRVEPGFEAGAPAMRERARRRFVDDQLRRAVRQQLERDARPDRRQRDELAEHARPRGAIGRHRAPEHVFAAMRDEPVEVDAPARGRLARQAQL